MSIQPTWPPAAPSDPLPFDQRGACWPRGPCDYVNRLQLRYDFIAVWNGGTPNPDWDVWGTGQAFIALESQTTKQSLCLRGKTRPATASHDTCFLEVDTSSSTGWRIRGQTLISSTIPAGASWLAEFPTQLCVGSIIIIPTVLSGPDPPDFIEITQRRWYQPTSYPYYG